MGAGFSHSPVCAGGKERYVFFSFPHIRCVWCCSGHGSARGMVQRAPCMFIRPSSPPPKKNTNPDTEH
jgi:hypothetical protein